jgi:hypothetical protein
MQIIKNRTDGNRWKRNEQIKTKNKIARGEKGNAQIITKIEQITRGGKGNTQIITKI